MGADYLADLEISTRVINLLRYYGVTREEDLRSLSREAVLAWPGGGPKTWAELETVIPRRFENGMLHKAEKPVGFRVCSAPLAMTDKAVLVAYYGWRLWLPKKRVCVVDGRVTAPAEAISAAKDYAADRK